MKRVVLPRTDLEVSKFIYGTASLFNVGSRAKRVRLLEAARDNGFTHFDTAPYYGFGMAERDLASVLTGHPELTVTTKVGIYSPGGESQHASMILMRKVAGRIHPCFSKPTIDWHVDRARRALDASLRRLGRSSVDIYMLHEPQFGLLATDEWLRWLEEERTRGRVRHFGIAAEVPRAIPFAEARSPLTDLLQTPDSIQAREADALGQRGLPPQITYGYISAARRLNPDVDVAATLAAALKRSQGAIIVSTGRISRLPQYAALSEQSA